MKRSDIAGIWVGMLLIAGAIVFMALGSGVGAAQIETSSTSFSSHKVTQLATTGGDGFNWLLAVLGGGPFVIAASIALAASWLLATQETTNIAAD